jgi:hypothetical protein
MNWPEDRATVWTLPSQQALAIVAWCLLSSWGDLLTHGAVKEMGKLAILPIQQTALPFHCTINLYTYILTVV